MPAAADAATGGSASEPAVVRGESPGRAAWRRLTANRVAVASMALLALLAMASIAGPPVLSAAFDAQDLALGAAAPSLAHPFGTDTLGRDLLVRVLHGGRVSLAVGLCATLVSVVVGVAYGAAAGYIGGRIDAFMMRLVDILYALPFTIFVILLMVFFGRNLLLIFAAIGAVEWLTMARIVRGQAMSLRRCEFVEAARAMGFGPGRIIFRHIVPNLLGVVAVYATLTVPRVMLLEAFLSFLGLGVQPPMCSWGLLIKDGADSMEEHPWLLFFPAALFSATLFCLNFLGDGLRDAMDTKHEID